MFAIAGQRTGEIWLTFFREEPISTHRLKKLKCLKFHGQHRALFFYNHDYIVVGDYINTMKLTLFQF